MLLSTKLFLVSQIEVKTFKTKYRLRTIALSLTWLHSSIRQFERKGGWTREAKGKY